MIFLPLLCNNCYKKKICFLSKKAQEDNLSTQSSQCKYLWLNHNSLSVFFYSKLFFSCNNKKSMLHFLSLKGPKHDQVEIGFFYTNQTHMVRWLRDWRKKCILFMIGADICHVVFLANAEHTLKIMQRMLSIHLKICSACSA